MANDTIPFLVSVAAVDGDDEKGLFRSTQGDEPLVTKPIPVEALRKSLTDVTAALSDAVAPEVVSGERHFRLTEFTVRAEITAEGGVNLIGAAAKVGATAAVTLTFSHG